ncbi:MAG TPA: hypothetical protein VIX73_15150, partial [Kofleriaceae bacterium]
MVVVFGVGLVSTAALAQPPGATQPLPPLVESYRAQTIATDVVALVATFAIAGDREFAPIAIGAYLAGAPIVHLMHRRPSRAFGDLVLRCVPFGVAILAASGSHGYDGYGTVIVGGLGTALLVSVIDTGFLAAGDEPPPPP